MPVKAKPLVLKASHFMERPRIASWQNARSQLRHRLLPIISGHWSVHPMSALPPKADMAQRDRHVRLSWSLLMSGLGQKQTLADVRVMTFDVEQRQSESPKASTRPRRPPV